MVQSFAAYWFYLRFGLTPESLGLIFFVANLLSGVSALLASRLASRIGLVRTMVFTHSTFERSAYSYPPDAERIAGNYGSISSF